MGFQTGLKMCTDVEGQFVSQSRSSHSKGCPLCFSLDLRTAGILWPLMILKVCTISKDQKDTKVLFHAMP